MKQSERERGVLSLQVRNRWKRKDRYGGGKINKKKKKMWERGGMSHGTSIIDVRVTALDDALRCRCCRNIKVSLGH